MSHTYEGLSQTDRIMASLDCVTLDTLGGAEKTASILTKPNWKALVKDAMEDVFVDISQNLKTQNMKTKMIKTNKVKNKNTTKNAKKMKNEKRLKQ